MLVLRVFWEDLQVFQRFQRFIQRKDPFRNDPFLGPVLRARRKEFRVYQPQLRKTQQRCDGLGGENRGAFPKAGPIFQQPFSLLESAQTSPYFLATFRNQEKGVLAGGISAKSNVAPKTKDRQGYWARQHIWHSVRHSQERRTFLQKPPSNKTFSWLLKLESLGELISGAV